VTRVAVVSYALDASKEDKELALWRGIDEVVAELILEHDVSTTDVEDRFFDAIENAMDEKTADE